MIVPSTLLLALLLSTSVNSFSPFTSARGRTSSLKMSSQEVDPNYEAHLPSLLKVGSQERPSTDLAKELRKRYRTIAEKKREAAKELKTINTELAAELEEIADEMEETHENFVKAALSWDAWSRPSPDLPSQLRAEKDLKDTTKMQDPNFEAHLPNLLNAAKRDDERPSPELPSELRMMKFQNMAQVKRLAAKELRSQNLNPALAEELDDLASELEESTKHFQDAAKSLKTKIYEDFPDPSQ